MSPIAYYSNYNFFFFCHVSLRGSFKGARGGSCLLNTCLVDIQPFYTISDRLIPIEAKIPILEFSFTMNDPKFSQQCINNVYVGSQHQRGHGLGSFFTDLFQRALPFFAKGARAVGKEALCTGVHILDNVAENNRAFKEPLKIV